MPLLFAGGVCCWVGVALGVDDDLLAELEELAGGFEGAGAGAGAGVGAGFAAGVGAGCELADPDEAELEAGCEESSEVSDFFDRFFFVLVALESLDAELSALAEPEAAGVASAEAEVSDFLERFFLVVVVLESLDAELSAVAG
jgi:hypothetical protein